MGSMNRVFLMGNLTRDPELRQTASGLAVAEFGIAVSEKFKNKEGKAIESVCFAEVVVWEKQAEACGQYITKGSAVLVEGSLQFEQWQTADGQKRSKLKVRANRVQFLGRPRKAEEGQARAGSEREVEDPALEPAGSIPF
jgi:single-strand DNA-binding protein